MYHNCQLLAPDGEILCTCDPKKANWYVAKEIGDIVSEDPLTVKLRFEPKRRPILDNSYYTLNKDNMCVTCGATDALVRRNVVPHDYRRFFPLVMKDHTSHDVLLLCPECHSKSEKYAAHLREELSEECDAPVGVKDDVKVHSSSLFRKVKSAARALLSNAETLPTERREELEELVKNYFEVSELTPEKLKEASEMRVTTDNKSYLPHGLKVVKWFSYKGGLIELEKKWREYFLTTMQPSYLPEQWSINHNHERLAKLAADDEKNNMIYVLVLQGLDTLDKVPKPNDKWWREGKERKKKALKAAAAVTTTSQEEVEIWD